MYTLFLAIAGIAKKFFANQRLPLAQSLPTPVCFGRTTWCNIASLYGSALLLSAASAPFISAARWAHGWGRAVHFFAHALTDLVLSSLVCHLSTASSVVCCSGYRNLVPRTPRQNERLVKRSVKAKSAPASVQGPSMFDMTDSTHQIHLCGDPNSDSTDRSLVTLRRHTGRWLQELLARRSNSACDNTERQASA